jgi:hypothetical protein
VTLPSNGSGGSRALVEAVLRRLDARAAGFWRAGPGLVAYVPADDLDPIVARRFEDATRHVTLDQVRLGIVRAWIDGRPVVSRAAELPADGGSGSWLRAFVASRSVAVPIGRPARGVLSVALPGDAMPDEEVAGIVGELGTGLA